MIFLRSALFNGCFFTWTGLVSIIFIPGLISQRTTGMVAKIWVWVTLQLLRIICGITYTVKGAEHIQNGNVIYACKHQSAFETLVFWLILKHPSFILKRELTWIPFVGWQLMRSGSIAINRSGKTKAMREMITNTKLALARGYSVVIFPEGTRTEVGLTGVYQPGVAAIYNQCNVPIIPVALNSGCCWSRNAFLKRPGVITVEFQPAIPAGQNHRTLLKQLEDIIEPATRRLEKDAKRAQGDA